MRKAKNFCKGCGGCCGPVPITAKEKDVILKFMKDKNLNPKKKSDMECKFLDENKKCMIYSVRPSVCKLFGPYINLRCPNYNKKYKDPIRPKEMPVARLNDLEIEQVQGLTDDLCFFDEGDCVAKEKLYTPSPYDYRFKKRRTPKPISADKGKLGKNCNLKEKE